MAPGSVVVAACVVLNCSTVHPDLAIAAARLSELVVTVPKDAPPLDQKRALETQALVKFLQWNVVEGKLTGMANNGAACEGFLTNFYQAQRDLEIALDHFGHPLGIAESFRIQKRFLDAWDRELLIERDYVAMLRPASEYSTIAYRAWLVRHYRELLTGPEPRSVPPLPLLHSISQTEIVAPLLRTSPPISVP